MDKNTKVDIKKLKKSKKDPSSYSNEYRSSLGRLLDLSKEENKKIIKTLVKEIDDWKNDCTELHQTLQDWNDILEGVIEETDYPYEGAPNVHIDLIGICMKIYHTICTRSIFSQNEIWYGITTADSDTADQWVDKIEEMVNIKTNLEWNLKEGIRDAIYCAARDMMSALKIPYAEDYERVKEIVYVENVEQLVEEFGGNLEDSGLNEQEIQELVDYVEQEASEDTPVEIPIEYDRAIYIGPKAYLIERINFVIFPANSKSISKEDCRGYGDRYYLRKGEIQKKAEEGLWYKDEVEKLLKRKKFDEQSSYSKSRNDIVGIADAGAKDQIEFFDLVYYIDLDDDGIEEKYLVTISSETKSLMCIMDYPYRVDYFAIFRREKRPGQLDGRSIVGELEYVNEEVDHRHNTRSMSMDITNIPSFKGKKSAKKDFDANAEENKWKLGVIFWLEDPDAFEQFKVQPVDYGQSLADESNLMKLASLIVGFDIYTFSGRAMPEDPNAPGNKTAMLIEQGNLRMQNVLEELRFGVDEVSKIVISHLYQFGPTQIAYKTIEDNGEISTKYIPKRVLRSGIILKMRSNNIVTNPDDELKRWIFIRQLLLTEPPIAADMKRRMNLIRKTVSRANIYGLDKILPTDAEIDEFNAKQQQAAQVQGQVQQQTMVDDAKTNQIENAAIKAKAVNDIQSLKTKKVQDTAKKVQALTKIKESLKSE